MGGRKRCLPSALENIGRSERIRTSDPLVPNEVRYQAALHSDIAAKRLAPVYSGAARAAQG